jgi:dethiobiotin synthetase
MSKKVYFVAGTDTDVGKTLIATGLLAAANSLGLRTAAIKPIAAGCEETPEGLRNADALALQEASSVNLSYEQVNPIALKAAIAPHIAAEHEGRRLDVSRISGFCRGVLFQPSDFVIIEGAGGWRVPLNPRETLAGLAKELDVPIILVVGVKLGCINHAILTAEAISHDGLTLAGWVANRVDSEMDCYDENVQALKTLINAPLLGEIPYLSDPSAEAVAAHLSLDSLSV